MITVQSENRPYDLEKEVKLFVAFFRKVGVNEIEIAKFLEGAEITVRDVSAKGVIVSKFRLHRPDPDPGLVKNPLHS